MDQSAVIEPAQLAELRAGWDRAPGRLRVLAIEAVSTGIPVSGPVDEPVEVMRDLHRLAAVRGR